jgi:hypothetical protein
MSGQWFCIFPIKCFRHAAYSMSPKKHGGKRPGAGKKACRVDRLAAMFWADQYGVCEAYARQMLRETGHGLLTCSQWRAIGIIVETGIPDDDALDMLSGIK